MQSTPFPAGAPGNWFPLQAGIPTLPGAPAAVQPIVDGDGAMRVADLDLHALMTEMLVELREIRRLLMNQVSGG